MMKENCGGAFRSNDLKLYGAFQCDTFFRSGVTRFRTRSLAVALAARFRVAAFVIERG